MRCSHFTLAMPYQPGHDQPEREAVLRLERLAVHLVDEHDLGRRASATDRLRW